MNKALRCIIACLGLATAAHAQHKAAALPDTTVARMRQLDRKRNGPMEGMMLPEFLAVTTDGVAQTKTSLLGKVSLLIFWDPWCNCFNPLALGALPELTKSYRDFQIISMMADTGRLASFQGIHELTMPVFILPNTSMMRALNGNNGIPSCVLVDRAGIIVRISMHLHPGIFDEQWFADKIRELLMF